MKSPSLQQLIRKGHEGEALDFKKAQYRPEQREELLRDLISMANAMVPGPRHIVVGVEFHADGRRAFHSIPDGQFVDDAEYQQLVAENVEPRLAFTYRPIVVDGARLGVFEITAMTDPPYMMAKQLGKLSSGDSWVRDGSRKRRLARGDLDALLEWKKSGHASVPNVRVGFGNGLNKSLTVRPIAPFVSATQLRRADEARIARERAEGRRTVRLVTLPSERGMLNFAALAPGSDAISLFDSSATEGHLLRDADEFMLQERATVLELVLKNTGEHFLTDVTLELAIETRRDAFPLARFVRLDLSFGSDGASLAVGGSSTAPAEGHAGPSVDGTYTWFRAQLPKLPHGQLVVPFTRRVRFAALPGATPGPVRIRWTLHARELPKEQSGTLVLNIAAA